MVKQMRFNRDNIIKDSDPFIREIAKEVPLPLNKEDKQLLEDMLAYVEASTDEELSEKYNLRPAVGIAATQCGYAKKMIAIVIHDEEDTTRYALVNPKVVSESQQRAYLKGGEGCLSIEEEHAGYVPRAARIKIVGYDMLQGKDIMIRAKGYEAIVLQHELDHFEGILFYDRINKFNPFEEIQNATVIE